MVDDAATIKDSTNENNTDIDRWADARRLRINGKACSKPWRSPNLRGTPCRSRGPYCRGHDMRLPLMMKPWRRPNLPRPLHRIALEWELIAGDRTGHRLCHRRFLYTFAKSDCAKINAPPISFRMCYHSVSSGMAKRTRPATQSDTRNSTAAHTMP